MKTLAVLRREKDLTQTQLAAMVGLNQGDLSMLERGALTGTVRDEVKIGLERVFGVSFEDLVSDYKDFVLKGGAGK